VDDLIERTEERLVADDANSELMPFFREVVRDTIEEASRRARTRGAYLSAMDIESMLGCDVCRRAEPHRHCPECGSTEHAAADCDMEG
jgi:hypothetical protein